MKIKKKYLIVIMGLVIILAAWFRMHNYHDWLFFKFDQARDATLISVAIEKGSEELPLLGPRATKVGEDYLRLGPIYYYMQYFSGFLFNSTAPDVFAYPDLFFAMLAIPLFYIFLRLYFSRFHSLLLTILYAFCFLVIQYSRFSWNPNSVPFFALLSFYGLLRMGNERNRKKQLLWVLLWSVGLIIASQLHYFALFSLVGISAAFLFFRYKLWRIKANYQNIRTKNFAKIAGVFLAVFIVFYSPVIVSDLKTDWSNTKNFFGAFLEKPEDKTLSEKIIRNFREQAKGYFLVATSFDHREGHKADPYAVVPGLALVFSGIFLAWMNYRKQERIKKDFNLLVMFWIIVFFIVSIPMSYQLRPRFFVIVFPLVFILIGLWFSLFRKKFGKFYLLFTLGGFFLFLLLNMYGNWKWFDELRRSQFSSIKPYHIHILKRNDGVTLGQLERVANYMLKEEKGPIYYYSKPEYELPIEYLLLQEKPDLKFDFMKNTEDLSNKEYIFAVTSVRGGEESITKRLAKYGEAEKSKQFGQLLVHTFAVDVQKVNDYLTEKRKEEREEKELGEDGEEIEREENGKTPRLFWKDVFQDEINNKPILKKE